MIKKPVLDIFSRAIRARFQCFSLADRTMTRGPGVSEHELRHRVRPRPGRRRDLLEHLGHSEGVVQQKVLLSEDPFDDDAVVGQDGRVRVGVQREERRAHRQLEMSGSGRPVRKKIRDSDDYPLCRIQNPREAQLLRVWMHRVIPIRGVSQIITL